MQTVQLTVEQDRCTFWNLENGKITDMQSFRKTAIPKLFNEFQIKLKHINSTRTTKLYLITKTNPKAWETAF